MLVLKYELVQSTDCKSFSFKETTGAYDATTNLTGWGFPNATIGDITEASLSITKADGTITTWDSASTPPFYPSFPTDDNTDLFEITNEMLGLDADTEITDWIPYFTYTVTPSVDDPITTSQYLLVECNTICCDNTLCAAVVLGGCACGNKSLDLSLEVHGFRLALENAVNCEKITEANQILTYLQRLCTSNGCGCGC